MFDLLFSLILFAILVGMGVWYHRRYLRDLKMVKDFEKLKVTIDDKEFRAQFMQFLLAGLSDDWRREQAVLKEAQELVPPEHLEFWETNIMAKWRASKWFQLRFLQKDQ